MSAPRPKLEEILEFPATFTFQVIALHTEVLVEQCVTTVERVLERRIIQVAERASSAERYRAVRVTTTVLSADEVRAVYTELNNVPDVKLLL